MTIKDEIIREEKEAAQLRDICNSWEKLAKSRNLELPHDYEKFKRQAADHEQRVEWFKELLRLQSLEYHGDTYQSGEYAFSYHEMAGVSTISVIKVDRSSVVKDYRSVLESTMSHDEFVEWCKDWQKLWKNNRKDASNDR